MIKLQDFARERGVTDRQIQRLLQKYELEVEGLFQRKGPNGTWLSEEACEILRSKMKSNPVSKVVDTRKVDELKGKLAEAEEKIKSKEQYITALEAGNLRQQQRLNELEGNQLLLEESREQINNLKAKNDDLSAEKDKLKDKIAEVEQKASEDVQKVQYKLDEEKKYNQALEEWINLSWWKKCRNPKPTRNKE